MTIPAAKLPSAEPSQVGPSDEGIHPHAPGLRSWSESYFWDFCDVEGVSGGHCRLSLHPVEERAWLCLVLHRGSEWVMIEEPRLPVTALAARLFGLSFSWEPKEPLRRGQLRIDGMGRIGAGANASRLAPISLELTMSGLGPVFSPPGIRVQGLDGRSYAATHYEQAAAFSGRIRIHRDDWRFDGYGHREHAWGPRGFRHEWDVLTLHSADQHWRLATTAVSGAGRFEAGTLQTSDFHPVNRFDLELRPKDEDREAWSGRVRAQAADGSELDGELEEISAAQLDHSHAAEVPEQSLLRRAFVKLHPKRGLLKRKGDAKPPLVGWLETHRILA
jgi:hypothetical protein